jgi:tetratricopeptide (TPR) repeat protein
LAANRGTEPAKLSRQLRGELDWIVMKALEKDRGRRYETADGFAADVQRYLADEPVLACPPSGRYCVWKFVRRNKGPVLAALSILLALVAGVVGTTGGLIRAERHRLVVEGQRNDLAERNQELRAAHERERLLNERARQAIETVTSETAVDLLTREKELRPEQKDFLDKMIQYYAEASQDGGATEQERARQARAYHRMGRMNQIMGRSQDSENAYRRAVALFQQLDADFHTRPELRQELALSHNNLGILFRATDRPKEAEAAYREALAVQKRLDAEFASRPEFRKALAGIHSNLGNLLHESGRLKEAELASVEALTIRKRLAADFPDRPEFYRPLASSHNNLGRMFQTTSRPEKAESAYRDAIAFQKQAVANFHNRPEFRLELAKYQFNLGNLLRDSGRMKDAETVYGEALPIRKQLAADFPNRPEFQEELAAGHHAVGDLLCWTERLKEAEDAYATALAIYKQLAAGFLKVANYRNAVAGTLRSLANVAIRRRDFAAARKLLDEAFLHQEAALQASSKNSDYQQGYRYSLYDLTRVHAGQGDRRAALAAATKLRDLGWNPAVDAYFAACGLAQCVLVVEKDDKLDATKRQAEMTFYADRAMATLRDAVARGFKDAAYVQKDSNLDPLRQREDFKKVVAELQAKAKKN